jgi:hypothetical protein
MEYFVEMECDPLQIIGLYPNMLPGNLKANYSYPMEVGELGMHLSLNIL